MTKEKGSWKYVQEDIYSDGLWNMSCGEACNNFTEPTSSEKLIKSWMKFLQGGQGGGTMGKIRTDTKPYGIKIGVKRVIYKVYLWLMALTKIN